VTNDTCAGEYGGRVLRFGASGVILDGNGRVLVVRALDATDPAGCNTRLVCASVQEVPCSCTSNHAAAFLMHVPTSAGKHFATASSSVSQTKASCS
jgi:hypothetical protein